ncbi:MAG TPA: transglycosylase family protein [Acidimicrobiales bacterium]|jgi:hypothetical protein|nr:transglycosylase family protein [Acidimicrobiales bacterium]
MAAGALITPLVLVLCNAPAGADQVTSLKNQAKVVAQELLQDQLQASAYFQQYSVATQKVASDQRAIAGVQHTIVTDKQDIATRTRDVHRLALLSYILNGSVSATSGAGVLAENVQNIESANEYASITLGNINNALAQLHTARQTLQNEEAALQQQHARDAAEQAVESQSYAQANATVHHQTALQAQVTGQLAVAVSQQNAAAARTAAAAVARAQKTAAQTTSLDTPSDGTSGTTDPALPPFLQCVRQAESGGNYGAVSPDGKYRGAFQFDQATWNYAAQAAGRPDLVGVPPNQASQADQDSVAVALYSLDGERPWLGDRCSN